MLVLRLQGCRENYDPGSAPCELSGLELFPSLCPFSLRGRRRQLFQNSQMVPRMAAGCVRRALTDYKPPWRYLSCLIPGAEGTTACRMTSPSNVYDSIFLTFSRRSFFLFWIRIRFANVGAISCVLGHHDNHRFLCTDGEPNLIHWLTPSCYKRFTQLDPGSSNEPDRCLARRSAHPDSTQAIVRFLNIWCRNYLSHNPPPCVHQKIRVSRA